jgi:hypothetical protein
VLFVVRSIVADGRQGVVNAEAADGMSSLCGNGELSGDKPSCLLCAGDDEAFVSGELHLQGVRNVVLD